MFWTRNVTLVLIGEHVRERAAAAADVEHLLDAVEGHALDEALGGRHRSVVLRSRKKTHGEMWEEVGRGMWEKWGVGGRKQKRHVGEMGCGWAKTKTTCGRNGVWVGGKKNDKQKKTCARVYVAATSGSENQEAYDGASPVVITSRYGENGSCDMCEKNWGEREL